MIIYEIKDIRFGTHCYAAELISQAEINTFNKNGLATLLVGTNIPVNMFRTVIVDRLDDQKFINKNLVYERAKPYVLESPNEIIARVIETTPGAFKPATVIPMVKKVETPFADHRTTEDIRDDLEKQYREFILLLHKSEMELSSIRRTMEDALHKIQDQKILEKFHK